MNQPEVTPPLASQRRFVVRQSVSAEDRAAQLDLRYRVLREPLGMSREQAVFARDDDPDTVHLLAVALNSAAVLNADGFVVPDTLSKRASLDDPNRVKESEDEVMVRANQLSAGSHEFEEARQNRVDDNQGRVHVFSEAGTTALITGAPIVVGTATMITHGPNEVQLRGMASDPARAGAGIGRAVLEAAHALAGSRSLWCDARMSAHDFYARFGWVAEGEQFDIPQVGPHTVMRYQPDSNTPTDTVEK